MPTYIKIEWSGYWDFPSGTYNSGSKEGDPISGEFDHRYIKLEGTGNAEYEIDPGEITVPQSSGWSFKLINKEPATGQQLYPFDYLINLGRTEEYGGTFQHFGDLFIRASIPAYDNKVIFKGAAEKIKYSPYDFEVSIQCNSIIDLLKDSERQMFAVHEFGSCSIPDLNKNGLFYARSLAGDYIEGVQTHNGKNLEIERIRAEIESTGEGESGTHLTNQIHKLPQWPFGIPAVTHHLEYWKTNENSKDTVNNFLADPDVREILFSKYENNLFVDRYISQTPIEITSHNTSNNYFKGNIRGSWFTGFIKIENSTIFTQFRIRYDIIVNGSFASDGDVDLDSIHTNKYHLEVLHANNEKVTTRIGGKKKEIYERGRFFKDGDSYEDSKIKVDDDIDLTLIDYNHLSGKQFINEENNPAIADISFASRPNTQGINAPNYYPVHGAIFETNADNILVINPNEGYFDNVSSLVNMIESNFLDKYLHNSPSENLLFDASEVEDSNGRYSFYADLVHYGWNNNLEDVIVNTGRQVSAYLYGDEHGKIKFTSRKRSYYSNRPNLLSKAIQIYPEDYEIQSGFNYSYGSKYYKSSYSDRIEMNNITGEEEIDFKVNSSGEIVNTPQKAQELEVSNYRTSDLGVPSVDARTGKPAERILREPPDNLGRFLKTPVFQAITVADGVSYPSQMFSIALDVLGGKDNYTDISIGSIVYIDRDDREDVYLVKKVNYSPKRVRNQSLSLKVDLFKLFSFYEPITENLEDSVDISDETGETQTVGEPV